MVAPQERRHFALLAPALLAGACLPLEEEALDGSIDAEPQMDATALFDGGLDAESDASADGGYELDLCMQTDSGADDAASAFATRCADRACEVIGACCLAAGQCCAEQAQAAKGFEHCDAEDPDCFSGSQVSSAGDAAGEIESELGWLPWAAEDEVAALRWLTPLSMELATTVTVRVQLPAAIPDCTADCAQQLGFGLTPASVSAWEPSISVRLSAERAQAVLMLQGIPIATHPIDATLQEMSLALEPGGRLDWRVGGQSLASARIPFAGQPVHLVVFGSTDPGAETPARVESVSVTTQVCDTPTAWGTRDLFLGAPSPDAFDHLSQVVADGEEWFAMDGPRGLHLWRREQPGTKPTDTELGAPVLTPEAGSFYADAVAHPELAVEADELVVYFAGTAQGVTSIGRAVVERDTATLKQVENVLDATKLGVNAITEPSVLAFRGEHLMAARVVAGDEDSLALLTRTDGASGEDGESPDAAAEPDPDAGALPPWHRYTWKSGTLAGARVRATGSGVKSTDPELATTSGALLLYFTAQDLSGDRIAALASEDAETWLDLGPQLQPGTELDQLGVSSCDVATVGDELRMLFTATDGTVPQPAQTTRTRVAE